MSENDFEAIKFGIREFARKRNWLKFHNPKNLAMAINGEAGELSAEFQWLTTEESTTNSLDSLQLEKISLEMADIFIYLLRLSDELGIDLLQSVKSKMEINEVRFPFEPLN